MSAIPEGSHQPVPHQHPIPLEITHRLGMAGGFSCVSVLSPESGDGLGFPRAPDLAKAPVQPRWQALDSPTSTESKNVY